MAYIDTNRDRFGVEPIWGVLQFAPSTYWSAKRRPASARSKRDDALKAEIARVHAENFGVYGAPKVWAQLRGAAADARTTGRLTRPTEPCLLTCVPSAEPGAGRCGRCDRGRAGVEQAGRHRVERRARQHHVVDHHDVAPGHRLTRPVAR